MYAWLTTATEGLKAIRKWCVTVIQMLKTATHKLDFDSPKPQPCHEEVAPRPAPTPRSAAEHLRRLRTENLALRKENEQQRQRIEELELKVQELLCERPCKWGNSEHSWTKSQRWWHLHRLDVHWAIRRGSNCSCSNIRRNCNAWGTNEMPWGISYKPKERQKTTSRCNSEKFKSGWTLPRRGCKSLWITKHGWNSTLFTYRTSTRHWWHKEHLLLTPISSSKPFSSSNRSKNNWLDSLLTLSPQILLLVCSGSKVIHSPSVFALQEHRHFATIRAGSAGGDTLHPMGAVDNTEAVGGHKHHFQATDNSGHQEIA